MIRRMTLHVHEWGPREAPAVVCLHGVTGYGGRFRKLAEERLVPRFRVLAPDLRGHGLSTWEPPWDVTAHVADVRTLLEAEGLERATWIGHSFGGRIVLELIAHAPELVERAILLDPAVWVPPPIALDRAEALREHAGYSNADEAIELRLAESNLHSTPRAFIEEYVSDHLLLGEDGRWRYRYCASAVIAAFGEMARQPPPFDTIRVPTLLVRGAVSDVVPEVIVDLMRDGAGDAFEAVTVPGGHIVMWDAYEQMADAVDAFLR